LKCGTLKNVEPEQTESSEEDFEDSLLNYDFLSFDAQISSKLESDQFHAPRKMTVKITSASDTREGIAVV
jgi:hypothetical protein